METGHNKNVANFEQVIIILTALGTIYNPSQALILLAALQTKLDEAKAAMAAVDTAEAEKRLKVNDIQAEEADLDQFMVNIKRTVEVELNDPAFTAEIQSMLNRSRPKGRDTGVPDDPLTPEDESRTHHSLSQTSRDNRIATLGDILALLEVRNFTTTDKDYDLAAITAKHAALVAKNNAAKAAFAALGNAMDARDAILYDEETGIIKLVKLIKTQLAKNPGRNSTAYQQIAALEFRTY